MTLVIICHSVAKLLSAMWHLIPMLKNGLGGGDVSADLGIGRRRRSLRVVLRLIAVWGGCCWGLIAVCRWSWGIGPSSMVWVADMASVLER